MLNTFLTHNQKIQTIGFHGHAIEWVIADYHPILPRQIFHCLLDKKHFSIKTNLIEQKPSQHISIYSWPQFFSCVCTISQHCGCMHVAFPHSDKNHDTMITINQWKQNNQQLPRTKHIDQNELK